MKTIFEIDTHGELHDRLEKLSPDAARQWGKMTPSQMMEHTARVLEMATSDDQPLKQVFLGKAIAWIFKGSFLGEKPFGKNAPTGPDYIIKDDPDFDATRERLKDLITKFHSFGPDRLDGNVHPFFGRLTGKQWGETQYKHVDHHLRQFGV
jgi:Protein of unknown function (DUF1569)